MFRMDRMDPVVYRLGPGPIRRVFDYLYNNIFQIIILGAGFVLGSIVVTNLSYYHEISLPWKIAISTFIVILPISFFLQAFLLERSTVNSIASDLQSKFYNKYREKKEIIKNKINDLNKSITDGFSYYSGTLADDSYFFKVFKIVLEELDDDYLNEIYKIIFEKLFVKDYTRRYALQYGDEDDLKSKLSELDHKAQELSERLDEKAVTGKERERIESSLKENGSQFTELRNVLDRVVKIKQTERDKFIEFIFGRELNEVIIQRMQEQGINFHAYILPLSFFMFIYFAGILVTLPLLNSVFTGYSQNFYIPLFDQEKLVIPFEIIQWGFIGGLVYTSINLLNRFFRMDLHPKIYLSSSFRLIFATVSAVVIHFLFIIANPDKAGVDKLSELPAYLLLASFAVGIAPIQFLIRIGQSITLELMDFRRKRTSGNDNVVAVDGINLMVGERLGEAGIDCIQQLALCKPDILSRDTKFDILTICDWKDQALLYLYTEDVKVTTDENASKEIKPITQENDENASKEIKLRQVTLHELLNERLGIRTLSGLKDKWHEVKSVPTLRKLFFDELGIVDGNGKIKLCTNLFDNITSYEDEYITLMSKLKTGKYSMQSKWAYTSAANPSAK